MANKLSDFKGILVGGGSRANLFRVKLENIPGGIDWPAETFTYLCKAAQLPASNIASIDVPFRGRIFKVAGDRTFDTWTVTIINDVGMNIRKAMEDWMQLIAQYEMASGETNPADYMETATVTHLTRRSSGLSETGGNGLKKDQEYKFYDIFPTNISAIDLSYDSTDTIEEFTVEFQVNYWAHADKNNSEAETT